MLMELLGAKSLFGLARGWIILAGLLALGALAVWLTQSEAADDRHNQDLGAAVQRSEDLQTTLERTETANAARTQINDPDSSARYDQCLRTARTPANCQRFVPGL